MKSRDGLIRLKRFQVDDKRRQVMQIEAMMADFTRMVQDLENQVQDEQKRTGIDDVSHFAYSTFAKAAIQRRENLMTSIDDLKHQLDKAQDELAEAVEDLKKVEILEERDQTRERDMIEQAEQDELDDLSQTIKRRRAGR